MTQLYRSANCGLESYLTQCGCESPIGLYDEEGRNFEFGAPNSPNVGIAEQNCLNSACKNDEKILKSMPNNFYQNGYISSSNFINNGLFSVRETQIRFPVIFGQSSETSQSSDSSSASYSSGHMLSDNCRNSTGDQMLNGNRNSFLKILTTSFRNLESDYDLVHGTVDSLIQSSTPNTCFLNQSFPNPAMALNHPNQQQIGQNTDAEIHDDSDEFNKKRRGSKSIKKAEKHSTASNKLLGGKNDKKTPKSHKKSNAKKHSTSESSSPEIVDKSRYATRFTADQNCILNAWYRQHESMPYASDAKVTELARVTCLSEKSVRKWLSNKRSRKRNTNTLGSVVAYKKTNFGSHSNNKPNISQVDTQKPRSLVYNDFKMDHGFDS